MFFEVENGRLVKAEYVESHPQFGDHVLELRFGDYRTVGALRVPHQIESYIGDLKMSGARLAAVDTDATIDEEMLTRPADATEGPMLTQATAPKAQLAADELGEGVFYVENAGSGYNVMFVDTERGVVVLEPPLSPEISRAVIAKIEETLPGRPIVGVLMTHHHWDHSGGLRTYLDHGAVVITTPGNEDFVKMVAGTERSLDGRWAEAAKEPRLALVEGHRPFGNGATRIEVYDVGPSAHVDEILVAYLPGPKVLFVGDLYSFNGQTAPASPWAVALAEKIDELGLDVETVVPVHGVKTTMDNFREGVRLAQSGS
jgi:glyoxylase-like metal-dependent hydrolase (beta-lactamase superfamily II)